jgi:phospholipid transport system substrate-binding protein
MISKIRKSLPALLLLVLPAFSSPAAENPQGQLKATVDRVFAILKDESAPIEVRREELASLVQARFDLPTIARWVMGPYWREAGERERQRFIELFPELIKATYLGRVKRYNNEKVVFVREEVDGDRALVETRVLTARADVPVDYRLMKRGEEWLVYDVIIENISMVRNYRSTYTEIIRRDGLDGILRQMEDKIAELRDRKELAPAAEP